MACESIVRLAVPDDKQEILRLFSQAHEENGLFPFELDRVEVLIARMLYPELIPPWDLGVRGAIGVIGNGQLEAMAAIVIDSLWYSSAKYLSELVVYVDRDCRRSHHAKELLKWMKRQSAETGIPLLTGILSTHETEAKVKLYERTLPKAGAFFFFSPTQCSSGAYIH